MSQSQQTGQVFAQLKEGRVHGCEGSLALKCKKVSAKKWKRGWFRVGPDHKHHQQYHLTRSYQNGKLEKRVLSFPWATPGIEVQPLSQDPQSPSFTGFNVVQSDTGDILATLNAEDIVQQRTFMAALGGGGPGLYTQRPELQSSEKPTLSTSSSKSDLLQRQLSYDQFATLVEPHLSSVPTYSELLQTLPGDFYFPWVCQSPTNPTQTTPLPVYDPTIPLPVATTSCQKPARCSFHPPRGPPIHCPTVIGYGAEVGLKPDQMVVWDPVEKFYYFLDHEQQTVFIKDPRSPQPTRKLVKKQRKCSIMETAVCSDPLLLQEMLATCPHRDRQHVSVETAANRASKKPCALTLRACGRDRTQGQSGRGGREGESGRQGSFSYYSDYPAQDGTKGSDGENGVCGQRGESGKGVVLHLAGDAKKLKISGACSTVVHVGGEDCEDVVIVDCHGGNGGGGGCGGEGGRGGKGADGSLDGEHGGDGGEGGRGGRGGDGGGAGSGGSCVIQATDPRLLVLIEANCRRGQPGKGGSAGRGGRRGAGGFGVAVNTTAQSPGLESSLSSSASLPGKPGMSGVDGRDGESGIDGLLGEDGALLWVVRCGDEVLQVAESRYDAEVTSLTVSSDTEDGVCQPNHRLSVSGITVVNRGGLPLPAGAKLSIPSTETVRFEPTVFELPEICPDGTYHVPAVFHGRVFDEPPPQSPGPFTSSLQFTPRIDLLGRPFENSFLKQEIPVQYPLKLSFALSKRNVSHGDVTTLEVGVENVSQLPYGSQTSPTRRTSVRLRLDPNLVPVGVIGGASPEDETTSGQCLESGSGRSRESLPYNITYDPASPNDLHVDIHSINPSETIVIPIAARLSDTAQLGDSCTWQTELLLGGKMVEYKQAEMKVSPTYSDLQNPAALSDTLMVVTSDMNPDESAYWNKVFDELCMSVDYWDASYQRKASVEGGDDEQQQTASQTQTLPPFADLYRNKLILFPHCNLDQLPVESIVSHFSGKTDAQTTSSMVLFLSPSLPPSLESYFQNGRPTSRLLKYLCLPEKPLTLPEKTLTGHHLLQPGTITSADAPIKHCKRKVAKKLERAVPSQAVVVMKHKKVIQSAGTMKYNYGTVDLRRCPIHRSSNFQCIDGAGGGMTGMGEDDPHLSPLSKEVPLASNFGQVILSTLAGVPLPRKLGLLRAGTSEGGASMSQQKEMKFHLPNGMSLTRTQLTAICIASEVADSVFAVSSKADGSSCMDILSKDVRENESIYASNLTLVWQLLELIKREALERKRTLKSPHVAKAVKDIQRSCEELATRLTLASPQPHPLVFPQLHLLQDSMCVLRPQQVTTASDSYDLTETQE